MSDVTEDYHSAALAHGRMGCLQRYSRAARWWVGLNLRLTDKKQEFYYELQMGLDRMRDTGDYAPGGNFDVMYPGFRNVETNHKKMIWQRLVRMK